MRLFKKGKIRWILLTLSCCVILCATRATITENTRFIPGKTGVRPEGAYPPGALERAQERAEGLAADRNDRLSFTPPEEGDFIVIRDSEGRLESVKNDISIDCSYIEEDGVITEINMHLTKDGNIRADLKITESKMEGRVTVGDVKYDLGEKLFDDKVDLSDLAKREVRREDVERISRAFDELKDRLEKAYGRFNDALNDFYGEMEHVYREFRNAVPPDRLTAGLQDKKNSADSEKSRISENQNLKIDFEKDAAAVLPVNEDAADRLKQADAQLLDIYSFAPRTSEEEDIQTRLIGHIGQQRSVLLNEFENCDIAVKNALNVFYRHVRTLRAVSGAISHEGGGRLILLDAPPIEPQPLIIPPADIDVKKEEERGGE